MITSRKIPASTAKEGLNAQSLDNQRFRGTSVKLLKKTSCETKMAGKGTSDPKNLSLSMQRESTQANARPEKPKIASPKTFCKPALHELLTTSMNANNHRNFKVRFGSPSTSNVATLNAPSSPARVYVTVYRPVTATRRYGGYRAVTAVTATNLTFKF